MKILLTNRTYDVLKWIVMIVLPALTALLTAVGEIWAIGDMPRVVLTLNAATAFLGAIIGVSTAAYRKSDGNG